VLAPAAISTGFKVEVKVDGKRKVRSAVSFHTFRHTCASLLFEAGRNVKQVQEWLGHADPGFTLRTYVHLMDAGIGDAAFFDHAVAPKGGTEVLPQGSGRACSGGASLRLLAEQLRPQRPLCCLVKVA
jgi:hypothetical protein